MRRRRALLHAWRKVRTTLHQEPRAPAAMHLMPGACLRATALAPPAATHQKARRMTPANGALAPTAIKR